MHNEIEKVTKSTNLSQRFETFMNDIDGAMRSGNAKTVVMKHLESAKKHAAQSEKQ